MKAITLLAGVLVAVGSAGCATLGEAAGPWRGQVIDSETSQPIEGVVVLAVWESVRPGMVHVARDFHDVDEVVTDSEGRFVLPARSLSVANPFVTIEGPKLTMFKGGYGLWRFSGVPKITRDIGSVNAAMKAFDAAMKRFGESGAVFELPPLKTREQRREALPSRPFGVPDIRMDMFLNAVSQERMALGLSP